MEITFRSVCGSLVTPYSTILLLRDNVQHHLQAGYPSPGYARLHTLADPALVGRDPLPPHELWEELSLALAGIEDVPISDLAISIRTRALMTGVHDVPGVRGTILARLSGWPTPSEASGKAALGELFVALRDGLSRVTSFGRSAGDVEVLVPLELRRLASIKQRARHGAQP